MGLILISTMHMCTGNIIDFPATLQFGSYRLKPGFQGRLDPLDLERHVNILASHISLDYEQSEHMYYVIMISLKCYLRAGQVFLMILFRMSVCVNKIIIIYTKQNISTRP